MEPLNDFAATVDSLRAELAAKDARIAALEAALRAETERCAKIAEDHGSLLVCGPRTLAINEISTAIAAAIRRRAAELSKRNREVAMTCTHHEPRFALMLAVNGCLACQAESLAARVKELENAIGVMVPSILRCYLQVAPEDNPDLVQRVLDRVNAAMDKQDRSEITGPFAHATITATGHGDPAHQSSDGTFLHPQTADFSGIFTPPTDPTQHLDDDAKNRIANKESP